MLKLVREFSGEEASPKEFLTRISVKSGGRIHFLRVEELDWIEAADYYVKLHVGDRHHLMRESLNQLEKRLDPARFFRIHRSTIVNLERVREIQPRSAGDGVVHLTGGVELRCSRARREALQARLEQAK